ncbi:hypothetical protein QUF64_03830 [Anaerolineales bacterium HSG6]|nr:hypothetical protein [Anaerolineales bacterium HSG6]MDM8531628.1 hypothetical protein [Anaerolineales bacterium HSG25]
MTANPVDANESPPTTDLWLFGAFRANIIIFPQVLNLREDRPSKYLIQDLLPDKKFSLD